MGIAASARLAKAETAERHINRLLYVMPSDAMVGRLYLSHGLQACSERWWWVQPRVLLAMARRGALAGGLGTVQSVERRRSTPPEIEAAAVETAFVLGSAHAGERAAGVSIGTLMSALYRRGLKPPAGQGHLRGIHAFQRRLANAGNAEAAARIEARAAHERAVCDVIRCALALVPDQPTTGRYRMPDPGPDLDAAMAGLPRAAVDAVFPKRRS